MTENNKHLHRSSHTPTFALSSIREGMRTAKQARLARRRLASELAGYSSKADQAELDAIFSRYPEDTVSELRAMVEQQRYLSIAA